MNLVELLGHCCNEAIFSKGRERRLAHWLFFTCGILMVCPESKQAQNWLPTTDFGPKFSMFSRGGEYRLGSAISYS